jgi:hypothetical protein
MATLSVGGTTIFDGSALQSGVTGALTTGVTFPAGHIIQTQLDTNSNTGAGVAVTGSDGSTNSEGYQLFNKSFTPLSPTSKILLQTSNVFVGEEANIGNWGWLNAWYDTTKVASATGTAMYTAFEASYNWTLLCLNHSFDSWGTTPKNINVRGGFQGNGYIKNSSGTGYNTEAMTIGLTIMEIAQ